MSLKNKLILIVDNDDSTLKMLDILFKSSGATVMLEKDCKGTFSLFDQMRPDITILNLNEIDMDDSEYCKQIKEKFSRVVTPIIFTSTMPVSKYKERLSYLRDIHYFQKPYSSLKLFNTACEMLEIPMTTNQVRTFH